MAHIPVILGVKAVNLDNLEVQERLQIQEQPNGKSRRRQPLCTLELIEV